MRRLSTSQKRSIEHFGPMLCSRFFSYSCSVRRGGRYSYSIQSSIAIRPIGPQLTANRFDQRSTSPQFKQPPSTSTLSLSTASLSMSTTKSDARHEHIVCGIYHNPRDGKLTIALGSPQASCMAHPSFFAGDPSRLQEGFSRDMLSRSQGRAAGAREHFG